MKFGVHTSVRNGFTGALEDAEKLGCTAFQMFTQNPRGWMTRTYAADEFKGFRAAREKSPIESVVVHAPYLPNLCTSDPVVYKRSLTSLIGDLDRCEKLGADYLVIHPGAYSPEADRTTGIQKLAEALNAAIEKIPGASRILVENMAGGGRRIGGDFSEIRAVIDLVDQKDRVGVCFDTCHALAAGYDISTKDGVETVLEEVDKTTGMDRIFAFHVNDSKGELESHRDRHEHLGKGHVGLMGLSALLGRKEFSNRVFILETPKDTPEADPANLKILKSIISDSNEPSLRAKRSNLSG